MENTIDLLQIKIEKAKSQLSDDTLNAINAVQWKNAIIGMREKKGYNFEQLGNLETETELVLCGLLDPKNYSKELENRMKISKTEANELVNDMNTLVFSKIKEELIKIIEQKSREIKSTQEAPHDIIKPVANDIEKNKTEDAKMFSEHGIEILPEKLEIENSVKPVVTMPNNIITPKPSILAQKLSTPVQTPITKTEHSLPNISSNIAPKSTPKVDPYREIPE